MVAAAAAPDGGPARAFFGSWLWISACMLAKACSNERSNSAPGAGEKGRAVDDEEASAPGVVPRSNEDCCCGDCCGRIFSRADADVDTDDLGSMRCAMSFSVAVSSCSRST